MVIELKRKGDVTITTVILIVLGLVVLVMMIIGFTQGWDFFFGLFNKAPSELQQVAEACALYAQGSLSIDFCNYRLVGKEIVNCQDERIKAVLKSKGVQPSITCSNTLSNKNEVCDSVGDKRAKIKVNGVVGNCDAEAGLVGSPAGAAAG